MTLASETLLTSADVVDQTPISYRQLLYWERRGLITPSSKRYGHKRWRPEVLAEIDDLVTRINACPYVHSDLRSNA